MQRVSFSFFVFQIETPLTIRSSGLLVGKPLAYQSFVVVGKELSIDLIIHRKLYK